MNILITGARGFVGRNLTESLRAIADGRDKTHPELNIGELYLCDVDTSPEELDTFCRKADFVFHLAGVNRPTDEKDFMRGNADFTETLLSRLEAHGNACPIMVSSSIQAALDNPYGISKRRGEELIFAYGKRTGADCRVYRLPNLFGKWSRPNYNSVIATFCYNISRGIDITVTDRSRELTLLYIDDLTSALIASLSKAPARDENGFSSVSPVFRITLGELADTLLSFAESRKTLAAPAVGDPLTARLWATYLSFLPKDGFAYKLKMNVDARGSFTEFMRSSHSGQMSVNVSKPGITKGNHWHHTKNEKFLVVSGRGVIRFRDPSETEVIEYYVSGDELTVVDIPTGYTHSIVNLGESDLVTLMWASECFDPSRPDTYFEEV